MNSTEVKDYYNNLISNSDIGVITEKLNIPITTRNDATLFCNCPHHQSQSKKTLQISLTEQAWICWGCDRGGDVLQLHEFYYTGDVVKGQSGAMSQAHRDARDYLANHIGVPKLTEIGLSSEELANLEKAKQDRETTHAILTELVNLYYNSFKGKVKSEFISNYGFDDTTIDKFKIGYSNSNLKVVELLTKQGYTKEQLLLTGAFIPLQSGNILPFFNNRIILPFWQRGQVTYLTGRKTNSTPDNKYESGKYKKLPIYNAGNRTYISESIQQPIYNIDSVTSKPKYVIISEGVTDCITLIQYDFISISPTTVKIKKADWKQLLQKLRGIETIYICPDNELSKVGINGAISTAKKLIANGFNVKIIELPLLEKQQLARDQLVSYDIKYDGNIPAEIKDSLLTNSKIDINSWFCSYSQDGTTKEVLTSKFNKLIHGAISHIEMAIKSIDSNSLELQLTKTVSQVINEITFSTPLDQDYYINSLFEHIKKRIPLATLKKQLTASNNSKPNKKEYKKLILDSIDTESCRGYILEAITESDIQGKVSDYTIAAEAMYSWLKDNDAKFFRTKDNDPFISFKDEIYWLDSGEKSRKRKYLSWLYQETGQVSTTINGRTLIETLANLCVLNSQVRDQLSWLYTSFKRNTIYFNLNNTSHQIVKINSTGIELVNNGGNEDHIILHNSNKMEPISYIPDATIDEAQLKIKELIGDYLTCENVYKPLIINWFMTFLLMDYAATKPMLRFEGEAGSGKTAASKLLSVLMYGDVQHKKSTDAANYSDGSQNGLIILDNIETRQATETLKNFLITSVTGIAKEKRKAGTESETTIERTKCLTITTGIEPLGGSFSEVLSRSFTIDFHTKYQSEKFLENDIIEKIKTERDYILSAIINITSKVLAMIEDGRQKLVMELLNKELKDNDKKRCNDFLSLIYLIDTAPLTPNKQKERFKTLDKHFISQIIGINQTSSNIAKESNEIVGAFGLMFNGFRSAMKLDETNPSAIRLSSKYEAETGIYFNDLGNETKPLTAGELLAGLRYLSGKYKTSFNYDNGGQLATRIRNDKKALEDAGYIVKIAKNKRQNSNNYTIINNNY